MIISKKSKINAQFPNNSLNAKTGNNRAPGFPSNNNSYDYQETQVNTYIDSYQRTPAITTLADNGWVVAWSSYQDGSEGGVYLQRFAADGSKVGDESLVNTFTNYSQFDPTITSLSNGGWVVSWTSYGQDGSGWGVYLQLYSADGIKIGDETLVNSCTNLSQWSSDIAALPDGGWIATWSSDRQDDDLSEEGVYFRRFGADGAKIGPEKLVNTYTYRFQGSPSIATLADGGWIIAWESNIQDGSGFGIYSQRYDLNGVKVGDETLVNTFTSSDQTNVALTALPDGGWVATWDSGNRDDVYLQRFAADGSKVGDESLVNTFTNYSQFDPTITSLSNGGWVVSWTSYGQDGSGWGVYLQLYSADGTKAGPETQVNSWTIKSQFSSAITSLPDGGWVVAWNSDGQDNSADGIFSQRFASDGSKAGVALVIASSRSDQLIIDEDRPSDLIAIGAIDPDGDELIYSLKEGFLPKKGNIVFDQVNNSYSYVPYPNQNGNDNFVIVISDGKGGKAELKVDTTINPINDMPIIVNPIASQVASEDSFFSFTIPDGTFSDFDEGDILTYNASMSNGDQLPAWLSFDPGTRNFSGIASNDDVGTLELKVTATDIAGEAASNVFNVMVNNVNDAPTLNHAINDVTAKEGNILSFTLPNDVFGDVDVDDKLSYSATLANGNQLLSWIYFDPITRNFTISPDANVVNLSNGKNIELEVTATDNSNATISTGFSINVVNDELPLAIGDNLSDNEDRSMIIDINNDLIKNDVDIEGLVLFDQITVNPKHGKLINNNNVTLTYIPNANYNGIDNFTYQIKDSLGQLSRAVANIDISAVNDAPIVSHPVNDMHATRGDKLYYQMPSNTFSDIDTNDALTYVASLANGDPLPDWIKFDADTRIFTGTATRASIGTTNFMVTAIDSSGAKASETANLTILVAPNKSPTLNYPIPDQILQAGEVIDLTMPSWIFTDHDLDDYLSYQATLANGDPLPSWIHFDPRTRNFNGNAISAGTTSFKITATDTHGAFISDFVDLIVKPCHSKAEENQITIDNLNQSLSYNDLDSAVKLNDLRINNVDQNAVINIAITLVDDKDEVISDPNRLAIQIGETDSKTKSSFRRGVWKASANVAEINDLLSDLKLDLGQGFAENFGINIDITCKGNQILQAKSQIRVNYQHQELHPKIQELINSQTNEFGKELVLDMVRSFYDSSKINNLDQIAINIKNKIEREEYKRGSYLDIEALNLVASKIIVSLSDNIESSDNNGHQNFNLMSNTLMPTLAISSPDPALSDINSPQQANFALTKSSQNPVNDSSDLALAAIIGGGALIFTTTLCYIYKKFPEIKNLFISKDKDLDFGYKMPDNIPKSIIIPISVIEINGRASVEKGL